MSELKLSEQFRLRFQELRRACNDNPQSLINIFRETPEVESLAMKVKQCADSIDRVSTFRKIHSQVAPEFINYWQLYNSNWKAQVEFVVMWPILSINLLSRSDFKPPTFEQFRSNRYHITAHEPPEPEYDDGFDPSQHDGGSAIAQMIALLNDQAIGRRESALSDDDDYIANAYMIGIEAIEHLENVIGISIARVYQRWNKIPAVFVPKHISDQYALTGDRSLIELLNQAIRAYLAGSPAASIALCRSLLETILKNHYLLSESGNERRRIKRAGLGKVIELAVARYEFLDKNQLEKHRKNANHILHNYSSENALSIEDEIELIKFFRDLKFYIEQAPTSQSV